ncbi:MAG TPA: hypothetical protein VD838_00950 [Anaeromyxobacteraceae bacterium]|nr:hypothetical protein [Anaeromyxobacteraceae bacterium]
MTLSALQQIEVLLADGRRFRRSFDELAGILEHRAELARENRALARACIALARGWRWRWLREFVVAFAERVVLGMWRAEVDANRRAEALRQGIARIDDNIGAVEAAR